MIEQILETDSPFTINLKEQVGQITGLMEMLDDEEGRCKVRLVNVRSQRKTLRTYLKDINRRLNTTPPPPTEKK